MESSSTSVESCSNSDGTVVVSTQSRQFQGIKMQNPFTFKVGQVFTGFGVGCGVGIGVGRPINMGAIPVVSQVMSASRGATDAFSGVTRHVNDALRKVGAKNIEAGIGCGVGFGHGFGVGLALKPGIIHQVQFNVVQLMTKVMMKFGIAPNLAIGQGALPSSLQSSMGMMGGSLNQNAPGNMMQLAARSPDTSQAFPGYGNMGMGSFPGFASNSSPVEQPPSVTRTETVINKYLQNPVLKQGDAELNDLVGNLRSENNMLQMALKHQQVIEELREENEKLRQILVEDLKVSPSKIQGSNSPKYKSLCTDCFECRRKQRKI